MIASYAGCDRLLVVICLITAMAFKGNYYPGMRVNALDLSPNYAGTIIAISNGAAALSGIAVPIFIGYMAPDVKLIKYNCLSPTLIKYVDLISIYMLLF